MDIWRDGGMDGWRDGGMEGWRDGGREGGMEGWMNGPSLPPLLGGEGPVHLPIVIRKMFAILHFQFVSCSYSVLMVMYV